MYAKHLGPSYLVYDLVYLLATRKQLGRKQPVIIAKIDGDYFQEFQQTF